MSTSEMVAMVTMPTEVAAQLSRMEQELVDGECPFRPDGAFGTEGRADCKDSCCERKAARRQLRGSTPEEIAAGEYQACLLCARDFIEEEVPGWMTVKP